MSTTYQHVTTARDEKKFKGDNFTIYCQFKFNGLETSVQNPVFRMQKYDESDYQPFKAVGTYPTDSSQTEWVIAPTVAGGSLYTITIDPLTLDNGWYKIFFIGDYVNGTTRQKLAVTGSIEITELSRFERIANRCLSYLADHDLDSYLDTAGRFHHFKASSILGFVEDALDYINTTGRRADDFTIDTLPEEYDRFLWEYAFNKCLLSKARASIDNDMQFSDSGGSLSQQKYDKYKALYDSEMTRLDTAVINYKNATPPMPFAFRRKRLPIFFVYRGIAVTSMNYWSGSAPFAF